ncbi:ChaN family lipoprotein [Chitinibacteraceae bacterium HSL-7]
MLRITPLLALLTLLAGCASAPAPSGHSYLLLGEVHDNAEGHRLRVDELERRLNAGWRPAIAMEQFDREHQGALAQAQTRCGADVRCVIDAAKGSTRWDWPLYEPVIALAQRHQLPLLAANLSRADASRVVKQGFAGTLPDALQRRYALDALPAAVLDGQIRAVREGHCNQLPEALLPGMARAQIARDVVMADILQTAGRDVVLLAGNGHVRNDVGVPVWLSGSTHSVGYTEQAVEPQERFDVHVQIAPAARPDACQNVR